MHFLSCAIILAIAGQTLGEVTTPLSSTDGTVGIQGKIHYPLPNYNNREHHCGVPDVLPRALGAPDSHQSEPEEKRDSAGCDGSWCGHHYDLADRELHQSEPKEEKKYCNLYGPRGCLEYGDYKEKRDNAGCDNSHCIPPHALGGRDSHESESLKERKYVCNAYSPNGRCLHYTNGREPREY